jgi:hypothetical protein
MSSEEEQLAIARGLLAGTTQAEGGLRKKCIDNKRCGLGMICEHAQHRGQSVQVGSFWTAPQKSGECENYFPRTELGSTGDVPRRKAGQSRHNEHAPDRERERAKLLTGDNRQTQGAKPSLILPPHLQTPPDLGVTRHIKHGKDIKGDD